MHCSRRINKSAWTVSTLLQQLKIWTLLLVSADGVKKRWLSVSAVQFDSILMKASFTEKVWCSGNTLRMQEYRLSTKYNSILNEALGSTMSRNILTTSSYLTSGQQLKMMEQCSGSTFLPGHLVPEAFSQSCPGMMPLWKVCDVSVWETSRPSS